MRDRNRIRYLAAVVAVLGIVSLVLGGIFVGVAAQKNDYISSELRQQGVTLGLTEEQIAKGDVVDNAQEAQVAAETLAKHLQSIAGGTYNDLMAANESGKYDPTDTKDLTYTQGLNMENSFNLAVLSYGVIQETTATGVALIVIGIAVGATGLLLFRLGRKTPETTKT